MRRAALLAFVCFAVSACYGQNRQVTDSLIRMLNVAHDSSKAGIFEDLSFQYQKGDPDTMILYANKAITLSDKYHDWKTRASANRNKGTAYRNLGNYKAAAACFVKALNEFESHDDDDGLAGCYVSLGSLYLNMDDLVNAEEYYRKGIDALKKTKDRKRLATCYNNLGSVYGQERRFREALNLFNEALKIREDLGDSMGIASSYGNLGLLCTRIGDFDEALRYQQQSLRIRNAINDQEGSANTTNNIGEIYLAKGEYNEAIHWFNKGLIIASGVDMFNVRKSSYQALSECYEGLKDHRNAFLYYQKYRMLNDSGFVFDARSQLGEMMTKYETEKKEQQISLLKKDGQLQARQIRSKQHLIYYITGALIVLAFLFLWMLKLYRQKESANRRLQILDKEKNEFLGIAAHDLKTPLTTIIGYCQMQSDYFDKLSKDKIVKYTRNIQVSARRMVELIATLLDINAIEEGRVKNNPQLIELRAFFNTMLQDFEKLAAEKNIRIRMEYSEFNYHVHADPGMLAQVTGNLLSQAIHQSGENVDMAIRLISKGGKTGYELDDKSYGRNETLNGLAMHEDVHMAEREGSGYGLSIVRRIAEIMGAEIDFIHQPGETARLRVLIAAA